MPAINERIEMREAIKRLERELTEIDTILSFLSDAREDKAKYLRMRQSALRSLAQEELRSA